MRRFLTWMMAGAGMALAVTPGQGVVTASSDAGFVVESSVDVLLAPQAAYALIAAPDRWWSSAHTYSGDARNLRLDPRAGGCFCETWGDGEKGGGSVEHAHVVYAAPGRQLRLIGSLGPLQADPVTGILDFRLTPAGQGTRITLSYAVGGYMRGGTQSIAPIVDKVLSEQMAGLKRVADARPH